MSKIPYIIILCVVLPNLAHAGHGTIRETDTQIIVDYEGDADEIAAANIIKAKEEKLKEQEAKDKKIEAERIKNFAENHAKLKEKRREKFNEGYGD